MKQIFIIFSLLLIMKLVYCSFIGSPNNAKPISECGTTKCKTNNDCKEGYKCIYCYDDNSRIMVIGYNLCTKE